MSNSQHPPLQRHDALKPLSRDHYVALVQSQHLLKAAKGNLVDRRGALAAFIDVWDHDLSEHFDDEERLLLPLMLPDQCERLEKDHAQLRQFVAEGRGKRRDVDPGEHWVANVGQTLNDHVRWEERELFPAIEQQATEDQLRTLLEQTAAVEASRPRSRKPGKPGGPEADSHPGA